MIAALALLLAGPAAAQLAPAPPPTPTPALSQLAGGAWRPSVPPEVLPAQQFPWGFRRDESRWDVSVARPARRLELGAGLGKRSDWLGRDRVSRDFDLHVFGRIQLGRKPKFERSVRYSESATGIGLPPRLSLEDFPVDRPPTR